MPIQRSIITDSAGVKQYRGSGTGCLVRTDADTVYAIYSTPSGGDGVRYRKSTDGGMTFGESVAISSGPNIGQMSVCYDKWSGLGTAYISVAYQTIAGTPFLYFRTINTASSDALSTETIIATFASAADDGHMSLCRTRGGNVLLKAMIDAGVEGSVYRLTNANFPNGAWAGRTINEALAASDRMILLPGFAADNQDAIGIFWDASATEISRQLYDDSLNSWAETSIATAMTPITSSTGNPNFAAAVDLTNSRIVLVAWSNTDLLNADLRCWTITESAITEVTNVVLNSTDDQGLCAISIATDTGYWYVWYGGKSDGSETFNTSVNVYYKVSTDNGTTWGSEILATPASMPMTLRAIHGSNTFTGRWMYYAISDITEAVSVVFPFNSYKKAQLILGI